MKSLHLHTHNRHTWAGHCCIIFTITSTFCLHQMKLYHQRAQHHNSKNIYVVCVRYTAHTLIWYTQSERGRATMKDAVNFIYNYHLLCILRTLASRVLWPQTTFLWTSTASATTHQFHWSGKNEPYDTFLRRMVIDMIKVELNNTLFIISSVILIRIVSFFSSSFALFCSLALSFPISCALYHISFRNIHRKKNERSRRQTRRQRFMKRHKGNS